MKTTKKHFTIFKTEVLRLLKVWGLVAYEPHIWHGVIDDPESSLSGVTVEFEPRQIMAVLNKKWLDTKATDEALKEVALHEVLEVLLYRLESYAAIEHKKAAREEVHAIIQTIINVLRG